MRLPSTQNMEYKFVELMSLQYTRSAEDIVQHQITYRYNAMKVSQAVLRRRYPGHSACKPTEERRSNTVSCLPHNPRVRGVVLHTLRCQHCVVVPFKCALIQREPDASTAPPYIAERSLRGDSASRDVLLLSASNRGTQWTLSASPVAPTNQPPPPPHSNMFTRAALPLKW